MKTYKAKVTQYESGKLVVDPYAETRRPRYQPLLELEYGSLSTTQMHYRLLLLFPRKEGVRAMVKNLIKEASRVGTYFSSLFVNEDAEA